MENKKKKTLLWIALGVVIIALVLILAFCAQKPEPEPPVEPSQSESSESPAPVEPDFEPGIVRANYAEAIFKTLELGTQLEVTGEYKDYYIIGEKDFDLLVEKRFVRLNSEEAFSGWTGYAYSGAEVFSTVYMRDEAPIATLESNTELTVEDGKGEWLKISWADGKGYILREDVSEYKLGGGGYTPPSAPAAEPNDGTDVPITDLSARGAGNGLVPLGKYYGPAVEQNAEEFTPGAGTVIAENIEAYLLLYMRDDEVKVTEYDEEYCTIWIEEEVFVKLPRYLVKLEGDEEYTSRNGYAAGGAVVYEEYQLRNEAKSLDRNAEVTVIDEIPEKCYSYYYEGCYVVMVDGQLGYMAIDEVGETEFSAPVYNGGGSSAPSGSSGDVWTPPALFRGLFV